jgi:hypothetical protein
MYCIEGKGYRHSVAAADRNTGSKVITFGIQMGDHPYEMMFRTHPHFSVRDLKLEGKDVFQEEKGLTRHTRVPGIVIATRYKTLHASRELTSLERITTGPAGHLNLLASRRHQRMPRDLTALHWAVKVSATWCGICWYVAS